MENKKVLNAEELANKLFEEWDLQFKCRSCKHHYTWHKNDNYFDPDTDKEYTSCTKKNCECDEYSGDLPSEFRAFLDGIRVGKGDSALLLSRLKAGVSAEVS